MPIKLKKWDEYLAKRLTKEKIEEIEKEAELEFETLKEVKLKSSFDKSS